MEDFKFLSQQEWIDLPPGQTLIFDIEVFRNFLFIAFNVSGTKNVITFIGYENIPLNCAALRWFIYRHKLVGFNSNKFDMLILAYALTGASTAEIRKVNDKIILDNLKPYDFYKDFQIEKLDVNHIDVMEICPLDGGLKLYGARLHAKKIQEVPVPVENYLTPGQMEQVGRYCLNDLELTDLIYQELSQQIALRENMTEKYGIDVRSCSDAQIAEKVMAAEIKKLTGKHVEKPLIAPGFTFRYEPPAWIQFLTEPLQQLLNEIRESDFVVDENGYPQLPASLDNRSVKIGKGVYRLGLGGLHSSETCQAVTTRNKDNPAVIDTMLVDVDVASYYPALILNNKFEPEHLQGVFLPTYQTLVDRRLVAKKAKTTDADSLKIVINGLFGKFGSKWSIVYSPQTMIQVTLSGQLALLMLIEYAEMCGLKVVSANTDGLVFHIARDGDTPGKLRQIVAQWSAHTGLDTEENFYSALYSRDVNNYIALKEGGGCKTKGAFLVPEKEYGSGPIFRFHKNPDCTIVSKALVAYLQDGTPLEKTIGACQDIREFLIARTVKGGAVFTGEPLGKVVRWYYSRHSKSPITYAKSGNKVARSDGAMPLMELPEKFPEDVNFAKYNEMAEEALYGLGAKIKLQKELSLFTAGELELLAAY